LLWILYLVKASTWLLTVIVSKEGVTVGPHSILECVGVIRPFGGMNRDPGSQRLPKRSGLQVFCPLVTPDGRPFCHTGVDPSFIWQRLWEGLLQGARTS
jgi:hypothetical protein